MQKDPPRVKNANGSAHGQKGKRVRRKSTGLKRSAQGQKDSWGPLRVKRAKGSAEGAFWLPLVDFPTTLQKMPRVSRGLADIPYSCIRARSSTGSPEEILQQGERKVLDVFSEGKKCEKLQVQGSRKRFATLTKEYSLSHPRRGTIQEREAALCRPLLDSAVALWWPPIDFVLFFSFLNSATASKINPAPLGVRERE